MWSFCASVNQHNNYIYTKYVEMQLNLNINWDINSMITLQPPIKKVKWRSSTIHFPTWVPTCNGVKKENPLTSLKPVILAKVNTDSPENGWRSANSDMFQDVAYQTSRMMQSTSDSSSRCVDRKHKNRNECWCTLQLTCQYDPALHVRHSGK